MQAHVAYVVNGGNISRVLERSRGLLQVLQIDCKDASTVQSAYMSETDVKKSHIGCETVARSSTCCSGKFDRSILILSVHCQLCATIAKLFLPTRFDSKTAINEYADTTTS